MAVRPFRWSDVDAYADLVSVNGEPCTARWAEEYLRQPNLSPERDCFVIEDDGGLAGFVLVVPELVLNRAITEGVVRQDVRGRGHGRALLSKAIDHSRDLGAKIAHTSALPEQQDLIRLLEAAGFAEVKRQWKMRLEFENFELRAVDTPYVVGEMSPGEESVMTDLQNKAFGGSWGFAPNVLEEIAYRVRMSGSVPSDVLMIRVSGDPVAYCWMKLDPAAVGSVGTIWMIGSDPGQRGLGLGRAMINESVLSLRDRGARAVELTVYADNEPAVGLYLSVGFQRKHDIIWYEKDLLEGS